MLFRSAGLAHAGVTPYASLDGGAVWLSDTYEVRTDTGWIFEGAVGMGIDGAFPPIRVELASGYQKSNLAQNGNGVSGGKMGIGNVMANLYLDIMDFDSGYVREGSHFTPFVPYVFAGIGAAYSHAEWDGETAEDTKVAGNLGAGCGWYITSHLMMDVKYKYFFSRDMEIENQYEVDLTSHQILAGLRYMF